MGEETQTDGQTECSKFIKDLTMKNKTLKLSGESCGGGWGKATLVKPEDLTRTHVLRGKKRLLNFAL